MRHRRILLTAIPALLLVATQVSPAPAQNYPDKPIRIVVPGAPGGPTDVPARFASQILPSRIGQPVVVENRPGAAGAIGARAVVAAPPDGYTLFAGNTSVLALYPRCRSSAGYDPIKNFAPVAQGGGELSDPGRAPVVAVEVGARNWSTMPRPIPAS